MLLIVTHVISNITQYMLVECAKYDDEHVDMMVIPLPVKLSYLIKSL